MSVSINGTTGLTLPDGSTQATAAYSPWRNRIINGDMRIDQRNNGASVTPTSSTATYITDRFAINVSQNSKLTAQQSLIAPAGFVKSLLATSSSAYTVGSTEFFGINQRIEGNNIADFGWGTVNAATVTLSFRVYSSLTGTFGGALYSYSGDVSYPFSYTVSTANTWTTISLTIAGPTTGTFPTDNSGALVVNFSLGAGASVSGTAGSWSGTLYRSATGAVSVVGTSGATFYITGVQLEAGSTATPFERVAYSEMLRRCQRYYYEQTLDLQAAAPASALQRYNYPVPMRAAPTITNKVAGSLSNASVQNNAGNITSDGFYFQISASATNGNVIGRVNAINAEL